MKNIKNIKRGDMKLLPKLIFSLMVVVLASCDFAYVLEEANSKEDLRAPSAFFGSVNGDGSEWFYTSFTNQSSSASSYVWDFGDGTEVSTDFEPERHAYPVMPGSNAYEVTLTVSDNNGLTDVYKNSVTITDNGEIVFDYNIIYDLINTDDDTNPVSVVDYSSYQVEKDAFPENTLDHDAGTLWTSEDAELPEEGEVRADGEYVVYDLGSVIDLKVIQFTTNVKSESYGYQIWVSNTGADEGSFTKLIPETGDFQLSEAGTAEFQDFLFDNVVNARYVKLVGFGRFNADKTEKVSSWTSFSQIEFFKEKE